MDLKIFDVEHGACALLTADNYARALIDCGHNANTGWYPGTYLRDQGITAIEMLVNSNYDEDHVSGLQNVLQNVVVSNLLRNPSVSANILDQLKSEDGMGPGISTLQHFIGNHFTGAPTVGQATFQNVQLKWFYNNYPHFDDENNLSLVTFWQFYGAGGPVVVFPGDLEGAGWRALMALPDFVACLRQTTIFVASHHGRDNGWCDELRQYVNAAFVVISDKGYAHETQETWQRYHSIARGGLFRGENRFVLTTRNDGRIGFTFTPQGWDCY